MAARAGRKIGPAPFRGNRHDETGLADQHGAGAELEHLRRVQVVSGCPMMGMMDGMGWMMAGVGVIWVLVVILLVLGIAALVKFLRS
jgi:hypothetical protein